MVSFDPSQYPDEEPLMTKRTDLEPTPGIRSSTWTGSSPYASDNSYTYRGFDEGVVMTTQPLPHSPGGQPATTASKAGHSNARPLSVI